MAMQSKLRAFGQELAQLLPSATIVHYWHPVTDAPYLIWYETSEADSFDADNKKAEMVLTVDIEYFTRTEYDPMVDSIQSFLTSKGLWRLDSVLYENDTNLIHFSWTVEVFV